MTVAVPSVVAVAVTVVATDADSDRTTINREFVTCSAATASGTVSIDWFTMGQTMESIVTAWLRAAGNGVRSDSDFGVRHEMLFWMVMWYMFCDRYTTAAFAFPSSPVLAEFEQKVERSFIIGRTCVPRGMTEYAKWRQIRGARCDRGRWRRRRPQRLVWMMIMIYCFWLFLSKLLSRAFTIRDSINAAKTMDLFV